MRLKNIFTFVIAIVLTHIASSQEGLPIYTDYLTDNYYLIHPSMAGAANCSKLRLTARQQWFGHEDAPRLGTLSYNGRVGDGPSGIGGILYTDRNGFHSQTGVYATYAHHILFSRSEVDLNMLSFGLSAGVIQYKLDETTFLLDSPLPDDAISGTVESATNFNVDFGFSYQYLDYYAHATVKNVLNNKGLNTDIVTNNGGSNTDNLRRYLVSVGGIFGKYGSEWSYEPSIMFQVREATKEASVDVNAKVYKKMDFGTIWAGLSYRNSFDGAEYINANRIDSQRLQQITPLIGVNYKNFMFAYNYTHQTNSVVYTNGGFHQITLGINFNCRKERYDCNCPAVNY
ncbi:PorP/SprF family type IX secretion system membrane protein [Seonamhaeicola marinus]|uniref:Type IX secretion system membrane protein PorP/SprF n=1 Tax=Seonamhaeicola marinus TaxID=1912246 RepID=A0A5D0HTD5_9FLAO|nr:type IX secretion system membrane protein PorP/SprF [Seonamhaeicola marinus]TYA74578.1 type IX secretion system membrane protein PorP/SprF [Seonamhaeicola marinus]